MFFRSTFWVLFSTLFTLTNSQAAPLDSNESSRFLVETAQVEYIDRVKSVNVSGRLANKAEQKLSFKTSGLVATILVDEGERVIKGQLLAQLNQEEIDAQVSQAQSVYDEAKRNTERYQALYDKGVVPIEQLQSAETRLEVARSDLRISNFNKQHSVIIAPDDGRILKRDIDANEMISPFETAFVMSLNKGGWVIRSRVTDKDIVRMNKGDPATISLDAYPGQSLTGQVSEVGAAADPRSHLFEVEIVLDATDLRLHSGFISRLSIKPTQKEAIALLPIEAIVGSSNEHAQVFIINEAFEAEQRNVDIAWLENGYAAVKSGLTEGSIVVTSGATYLYEGAVVSVYKQQ